MTTTLTKTGGHTSHPTYKQLKERVLKNPASSFWLKGAITSLEDRDVLDAQLDVSYLAKLYDIRLREALPGEQPEPEREREIIIHCDEPGCGWSLLMAIEHLPDWHNLPCPQCHSGILVNDEDMVSSAGDL